MKGNVYDINEAYLKYRSILFEIIKKQYKSKFDEYWKIDKEELEKYIISKLGDLDIHRLLSQIHLNDSFEGIWCNFSLSGHNVGWGINISKDRNGVRFYSGYEKWTRWKI